MLKYIKQFFKRYKIFREFAHILRAAGEGNCLVYRCRDYTQNELIRNIIICLVTPFSIMKYFFTFGASPLKRKGLAFVLSAKNEAPYVEEWINFHIKQGVSHFLIYDDYGSTDNLHDILKKYIDFGLVTYHVIKGGIIRQTDIYNIAVASYKQKFRYMAFIDADEFLFVRRGLNLYEFIDEFMNSHPDAGGLGVNWLVFGSGGHEKKPDGGVLESYVMCAEKDFGPNHHIKTICDPMKVLGLYSPHYAVYRRGFYNLNENGEIIEDYYTKEVNFEKIRINHYYSKSKEEFITRRGITRFKGSMEGFYHHNKNDVRDTEIFRNI